jgi:hypothetical protein
MAHIERVQTGEKVETHIRGRVFRFAPKVKRSRNVSRNKERRMVCVLNRYEGQMLERWSVSQACFGPTCNHTHQTRAQVDELAAEGILRYVPGSSNNVAAYSFGRTWKGVPSGPSRVKVMQLV